MPPTSPRLSNALLLAIDTKFTRSRILTSLIILPTIFASQLHKLRTSSYVNAFLGTGHTTRTGTLIVTFFVVSPAIRTCKFSSISPIGSGWLYGCDGKLLSCSRHNRYYLLRTLHLHISTSLTRFPTFTANTSASARITTINALIGCVTFLSTSGTRP